MPRKHIKYASQYTGLAPNSSLTKYIRQLNFNYTFCHYWYSLCGLYQFKHSNTTSNKYTLAGFEGCSLDYTFYYFMLNPGWTFDTHFEEIAYKQLSENLKYHLYPHYDSESQSSYSGLLWKIAFFFFFCFWGSMQNRLKYFSFSP